MNNYIDYDERQSDETWENRQIDLTNFSEHQKSFVTDLVELNRAANSGRGAIVIFTILRYLGWGQFGNAYSVVMNDLDKIRSYPEIYSLFESRWNETFPNEPNIIWNWSDAILHEIQVICQNCGRKYFFNHWGKNPCPDCDSEDMIEYEDIDGTDGDDCNDVL
jgi:hypothetical protein